MIEETSAIFNSYSAWFVRLGGLFLEAQENGIPGSFQEGVECSSIGRCDDPERQKEVSPSLSF